MPARPLTNHQRISDAVLTLGVISGGVLCYFLAIPFLPAIVWSVTLAVLFAPLNAAIRKKLGSPDLSALATVAIVAFIVVVPAILVTGTLLNEAVRSAAPIRAMIDTESWIRAADNHPWVAPALRWINEKLDLPDLIQALTSWLAGWSGSVVRASFSGVANALLTFYFLFYFLRDKADIIDAIKRRLPLADDDFARIADRVVNTIFATVFGTVAVAALQGGLGGIMFWWLGLPAPVFWGVLMALLAAVPFLGAFVVWAPAAAYLALTGNYTSAAVLAAWGTIVVGLVDNIVYPILVGNRLMMHTIVSFIAVVGGLMLLGVPGVVLGPLIVAVSLTLLDIWRHRTMERVDAGT